VGLLAPARTPTVPGVRTVAASALVATLAVLVGCGAPSARAAGGDAHDRALARTLLRQAEAITDKDWAPLLKAHGRIFYAAHMGLCRELLVRRLASPLGNELSTLGIIDRVRADARSYANFDQTVARGRPHAGLFRAWASKRVIEEAFTYRPLISALPPKLDYCMYARLIATEEPIAALQAVGIPYALIYYTAGESKTPSSWQRSFHVFLRHSGFSETDATFLSTF
jgi:hypothetical protein